MDAKSFHQQLGLTDDDIYGDVPLPPSLTYSSASSLYRDEYEEDPVFRSLKISPGQDALASFGASHHHLHHLTPANYYEPYLQSDLKQYLQSDLKKEVLSSSPYYVVSSSSTSSTPKSPAVAQAPLVPAQYVLERHTSFHYDGDAAVLFQAISSLLGRDMAVDAKLSKFKIKARCASFGLGLAVRVWKQADGRGVVEFQRRQGDSLQFLSVYRSVVLGLADVASSSSSRFSLLVDQCTLTTMRKAARTTSFLPLELPEEFSRKTSPEMIVGF